MYSRRGGGRSVVQTNQTRTTAQVYQHIPEGVGCLGVERAEARDASSRAERLTEGGTVVGASLHYVFLLSVLSCLSQEYAVGILARNGSLAPMQISPLFLLTRIPGANKIAHKHKTRTSPFCPLPVQSGRECDSCSGHPTEGSLQARYSRAKILREDILPAQRYSAHAEQKQKTH